MSNTLQKDLPINDSINSIRKEVKITKISFNESDGAKDEMMWLLDLIFGSIELKIDELMTNDMEVSNGE